MPSLIQRHYPVPDALYGMMCVSLYHSWVPVAKQLLDEVDAFPLLRKPRCKSVTEIVEPETAYFGSFQRAPECPSKIGVGDPRTIFRGKHQVLMQVPYLHLMKFLSCLDCVSWYNLNIPKKVH